LDFHAGIIPASHSSFFAALSSYERVMYLQARQLGLQPAGLLKELWIGDDTYEGMNDDSKKAETFCKFRELMS
jgi:hypothetical protein